MNDMDGVQWEAVLDRGVTAVIALYVIFRLEPRFAEVRDVVRDVRDAVRELTAYLRTFNGRGIKERGD